MESLPLHISLVGNSWLHRNKAKTHYAWYHRHSPSHHLTKCVESSNLNSWSCWKLNPPKRSSSVHLSRLHFQLWVLSMSMVLESSRSLWLEQWKCSHLSQVGPKICFRIQKWGLPSRGWLCSPNRASNSTLITQFHLCSMGTHTSNTWAGKCPTNHR